jgi:drug/metabolite transporter (DMT)-like permease
MQKPPALAWVLIGMLALIWGSSFILIKRGLIGLAADELAALRIVAASAFLLPFALRRLKLPASIDWKFLLSVGMLGSLFPAYLFALAQTRIDSAISGVLNGLTPIFTVLISYFIFKKRHPAAAFIGVMIGFMGTTALMLVNAEGGISLNYYSLFVVLATVFYGLNLNIIKVKLQHLQPLTVTSLSILIVGPMALVYLLGFTGFTEKIIHSEAAQLSAVYVVVLGILGTAIALILFNQLVRMTEPVFTSSVTYLIPVVAVVWGVWDGEVLLFLHYLSMAVIAVGVFITSRARG